MTDAVPSPDLPWVTVYDAKGGWCTVTAAVQSARHWSELSRDDSVSDPGDQFLVYNDEQRTPVLFRIVVDDDGPCAIHDAFNATLLGSPTLWPYSPIRHFVWWHAPTSPWRDSKRPTAWTRSEEWWS